MTAVEVSALIEDLREQASLRVQASDFRPESVPVHLQMRFRVTDEHGRFLGASRHLAQLKADLGSGVQGSFQQALRQAGLNASAASAPSPGASDAASSEASLPASLVAAQAASSGDRPTATDPTPTAWQAEARHTAWTFGRLPELLELTVKRPDGMDTLLGYPALVDDGDAVKITVHDEPEQARRQHLRGLACLFRLALREPLRFFARSLPDFQRLSMLYMPFGGSEELRQDLIHAVLLRTALLEPWPEDATGFETRVRDARPRITLVGNEIARTLGQVLDEHTALQRKLAGARNHGQAHADLSAQLAALLPRDFLATTPIDRLAHLPRYLKAASARLDKLRADPARDARLMSELAPMLHHLHRARGALRGEPDARLDDFRWMLEELRVSLFAQELRTPMPVSVKRLQKIWESMR
ncbi:MAG: DUF3418 domain-containing protein [Burkholderiaceae bacterium]